MRFLFLFAFMTLGRSALNDYTCVQKDTSVECQMTTAAGDVDINVQCFNATEHDVITREPNGYQLAWTIDGKQCIVHIRDKVITTAIQNDNWWRQNIKIWVPTTIGFVLVIIAVIVGVLMYRRRKKTSYA